MPNAALPATVRTQAFIDGEFTDALDHATFDTLAPANGQVIAEITACGEADVERAVRAARAAFDRGDWSRAAPADRKAVLLKFAQLIDEHRDELALTEGPPRREADHRLPRLRPARRAGHHPLVRRDRRQDLR